MDSPLSFSSLFAAELPTFNDLDPDSTYEQDFQALLDFSENKHESEESSRMSNKATADQDAASLLAGSLSDPNICHDAFSELTDAGKMHDFTLNFVQAQESSQKSPIAAAESNSVSRLDRYCNLDQLSLHTKYPQTPSISTDKPSLPRQKSKYELRNRQHKASLVSIPVYPKSTDMVQNTSLSLQRWRDSPPEEEPASFSAIREALRDQPSNSGETRHTRRRQRSKRSPHNSLHSISSFGSITSASSHSSKESVHSVSSQTKNRCSTYRRSRTTKKDSGNDQRIFKCTFCCDCFKTKYDWARHEKSLHLQLDEWICAPYGGSVVSAVTDRLHCAYCNALEPTQEHLAQHLHNMCQLGTPDSRNFRRKDHLIQHLRHFHRLEVLPLIDDWKRSLSCVSSRCGFCELRLSDWTQRTDHLALHFRKGSTMAHWKGDHGFDPLVAARVTNAIPPYLIREEMLTQMPFSATNIGSKDHHNQIMSQMQSRNRATGPTEHKVPSETLLDDFNSPEATEGRKAYTDLLAVHLSRYAREQISHGVIPTDEMFQQESRKVLYDCEDAWNQTVADNPQWLAAFRQQNKWDRLDRV